MKAAVVTEQGVQYKDAPKPSPKSNEILIKVRAASLNRADLAVASGQAHGRVGGPGTIVGLECAGEVEAVGSDVKDFKPGDRVMSSAAGGFAEYAVTDSGRAHRIPANNMTYEQAACMPVAVQTMHNALVGAGRLEKGESVLIQGASSGVGLLGMQIAKFLGASIVMGTSTNDGRRARLKEFGCDLALDTRDPKWPDKVKEATGGKGVDVVYDPVGGEVLEKSVRAAAYGARMLVVGFTSGGPSKLMSNHVLIKGLSVLGVRAGETIRRHSPELGRDYTDELPRLAGLGVMRPHISHRFPMERAADAFRALIDRQVVGKAVIEMPI